MSISKHYLLEQIRRSRFSTLDDNNLYDINNKDHIGDLYHNKGHLFLLMKLEEFIMVNKYNKKVLRKILKQYRKYANEESKVIENKYDDFDKIYLSENELDYKKLFFYYGIECEVDDFLDIINGKTYVSKAAYISTDWSGWLNKGKGSENIHD